MRNLFSVIAISLLLGLSVTNGFAQQMGSVSGQVQDSLGNIVPGAKVTIIDSTGKEKTVATNKQGEYAFSSLIAGTYTVRVLAPKFAP